MNGEPPEERRRPSERDDETRDGLLFDVLARVADDDLDAPRKERRAHVDDRRRPADEHVPALDDRRVNARERELNAGGRRAKWLTGRRVEQFDDAHRGTVRDVVEVRIPTWTPEQCRD